MKLFTLFILCGAFFESNSRALTVAELNKLALEEMKQSTNSTTTSKVMPAKDSTGKIKPVILQVPNVTDDDLHYNLPIEIYNSLTAQDKNLLQSECYMLGEAERAECKKQRYYKVLAPAKKLCGSGRSACLNDRVAVVDYCAKHSSDSCEAEQTKLLKDVRKDCIGECQKHPDQHVDRVTGVCGQYECRRDLLQIRRGDSTLQKALKPSTAPKCPTCP